MLHRFTDWFSSTGGGQQRVTDAVAAAGVTSWWWVPVLEDVSKIAAALLPIFALLWLLARIGVWMAKPKGRSDE